MPIGVFPRTKTHRENISKALKGKKRPKEVRDKISEALRGKHPSKETRAKMSEAHKGEKCHNYGKSLSKETRRKISETMRKRQVLRGKNNPKWKGGLVKKICLNCGKEFLDKPGGNKKYCSRDCVDFTKENNPNWRGGTSFEPYPVEFNEQLKEKIRKRDNYTCQICGRAQKEEGRKLSVHHIDYDKSNNDERNLITSCASHHMKTNTDREVWMVHLQEIVERMYKWKLEMYKHNGRINDDWE